MTIEGWAEPAFAKVREAFTENFERHGDVGAAVAVYLHGRPVVDLWGGEASPGRPWTADTMVNVFSTTKGATATCAQLLAERGELDLDAPVAQYWPEFAAAGKDAVPVRWLLAHRAGLPVIEAQLTLGDACAWTPVVDALAAQAPSWEPGTAHGYHAVTFGHLVGEVVRRVCGRSLGRFFADEVAGPLGLDFHIGLPESLEARVATMQTIPLSFRGMQAAPAPLMAMGAALTLGGAVESADYNTREVHAAEFPAANGIATARAVARMYAAVVGEVDGMRVLKPETVAAAIEPRSDGPDRILFAHTRFGSGYMLHGPFSPIGLPRSFGHTGAGGSAGWCDPDAGLSIGYVMTRMQLNMSSDPRMLGLARAAYEGLA